jgi:hypothetical protein
MKKKIILILPILLAVFFACNRKMTATNLANNAEIRTFLNYFFLPGSSLTKVSTEPISLKEPTGNFKSSGTCPPNRLCNPTKEYYLVFTPNFRFERENGKISVSEAGPDAFVDLFAVKQSAYYRLSQTGPMGSIYGAFWLSEFSFVDYGMGSSGGFIEVFDIKALSRTTYIVEKSKKKPSADLHLFLISKYGTRPEMYGP